MGSYEKKNCWDTSSARLNDVLLHVAPFMTKQDTNPDNFHYKLYLHNASQNKVYQKMKNKI